MIVRPVDLRLHEGTEDEFVENLYVEQSLWLWEGMYVADEQPQRW